MNNFILLTSMLFVMTTICAQDYQISFTGSGQSTTVDSVQVFNLKQETSITLNGSDILHLSNVTGINNLTSNKNSLLIYPNPMNANTNIEFYNDKPDQVDINIYDMNGKIIARHNNPIRQGKNTFEISGLRSGVYTVFVTSAGMKYSSNLISTNNENKKTTIKYINSNRVTIPHNKLKNRSSLLEMLYNDGDRLLLKGYSGNYARFVTLIPTQSQTNNFEFIPCTDSDGNSYAVVTIGTQTWMAENMRTTKYRNEVRIPKVLDENVWKDSTTAAYRWCEDDSIKYKKPYGALYNWYAVNDSNNIAPVGWHVSTDKEWTTLITYLGGENVAGGKLRETGTEHWISTDTSITNESGFTSVGAGSFTAGFSRLIISVYWSSTQTSDSNAWEYYMIYLPDYMTHCIQYDGGKKGGFSVRCVKD